MKHEDRYELICKMIRDYDSATGNGVAEELIKNPHKYATDTWLPFYPEAARMLIEARQGMDSAVTSKTVLAALNRIYKGIDGARYANMKGFFPSGERWALCDGFRFVRLNSKPNSIPDAPENPNPFNLDKCVPENAKYAEEVELPSIADVKAFIASNKTGSKGLFDKYKPMEALPGWWCNPQFLLDMLQALPDGKAHKPEGSCKPLYYESADGDALLLPVRPPVNAEQAD